jgi:hypothetical protein
MPRISLPFSILVLAACAGSGPGSAPTPDATPTDLIREDEIKSDLFALAGDHFRGREAGTLDELRASMWLAERARHAGLEPAGDDGTWFQFWPLKMVRLSGSSTVAVGSTTLAYPADVVVFTFKTAFVDAPLVLAGDGRADALAGADLEGKVAVVRMGPPARQLPVDISLRQTRYAMANVAERVPAVAAKKPAAIVLVADEVADSGWSYIAGLRATYGLEFSESLLGVGSSVPVLWMHQSALPLLSVPGQHLKATLIAERISYPSVNVVARVRGTDPALNQEYVLFSAHQDHDGIKAPVAGDSIWNGADDNGSVSVGILAIGRAWARRPARRSALFIWHGAEEKGLLGSRYHAANPVVPLSSIVAVLNADMIGGNSPDSAALLGAQPPHLNSRELADMALAANNQVSRFALDTLWDRPTHPENWYFRSDHVPYARLGIPSIYFSSLPHPLYHTPLDDPEHINYPKVTRIARWMSATGWAAANADQRVKPIAGPRTER